MSRCGTIKTWNTDKAFGFIRPEKGGNDVFIHISDFNDRNNPPQMGQRVTYQLSKDSKGRVYAKKVKRSNDVVPKKPAKFGARLSILLATTFSITVVYSAHHQWLPANVAWYLLGISIVTFIMYAWDKSSATNGRWRTEESRLHLLSILGGWPGAALAQQLFRHKTKKIKFRVVFWLTLFINLTCLYWLFAMQGVSLLKESFHL